MFAPCFSRYEANSHGHRAPVRAHSLSRRAAGDRARGRAAATVYVAASGSDSAIGTITAPFATIQHAVSVLGAGGGTVVVRGGGYAQIRLAPGQVRHVSGVEQPGLEACSKTEYTGFQYEPVAFIATSVTSIEACRALAEQYIFGGSATVHSTVTAVRPTPR
jgi:hypothetical protein